jgi:pyrimidine operon attenuation protein/uracil phosphoribosyltransferase
MARSPNAGDSMSDPMSQALTPGIDRTAVDAEAAYARLREQLSAVLRAEQRTPVLVGVHSGGAWVAERLHADLGLTTPIGYLSSAFHRDDYGSRGLPLNIRPTVLPFDVEAADLIVVDDVLYTGRTVRAALNEVFDHGRPARVELAVLVDRGGRELPIIARHVGVEVSLPAPAEFVLSQDTQGHFSLRIEDVQVLT